jgi:hypothetical protein
MSERVPKQIHCLQCGKIKLTYSANVKFCSQKCKIQQSRKVQLLSTETTNSSNKDLETVIYFSLSRGNHLIKYETTTISDIKNREYNENNNKYWTKEEFYDFGGKFYDICGCGQCLDIWEKEGYRRYREKCSNSSIYYAVIDENNELNIKYGLDFLGCGEEGFEPYQF